MKGRSTRMTKRTTFSSIALVLAVLAASPRAHAEPTAADKAAAEGLFDQARTLMRDSRFEEACPKFAESQRLDPAVGTLVYLADCYERTNRIASAWATFREAGVAAKAAGQKDRVELAKRRADALEAQLPKLVVNVHDVPGLRVSRGDIEIGKASWGTPIPMDPGDVVVTAHADGYEAFTKAVKIDKGAQTVVDVPELARKSDVPPPAMVPTAPPVETQQPPPTEASPPPAPPPSEAAMPIDTDRQRNRRMLAYGVGGAGVAGIAVGSIFGLLTFSKWGDAQNNCPNGRCTTTAKDLGNTAGTFGDVSTVSFIVGGVLLAGGTALYFTSTPSKRGSTDNKSRSAFIAPSFGAGSAGLVTGGTFE
jgi:serine/threonine-protein kinase